MHTANKKMRRMICLAIVLLFSVSLAVGAVYNWLGVGTTVKDIDLRYRTESASFSVKLLQPTETVIVIH